MTTYQTDPRPDPDDQYRVPSGYARCRRAHCPSQPVADLRREIYPSRPMWWAYCAGHLAEYGREVRDGQVWWVGIKASQ